jgi:hypothetical protein
MALNQSTKIDKIEILENYVIQVRQRIDIIDDSKNNSVVASNFDRFIFCPGDNLNGQDEKIIAIANLLWTESVITTYKASLPTQTTIGV